MQSISITEAELLAIQDESVRSYLANAEYLAANDPNGLGRQKRDQLLALCPSIFAIHDAATKRPPRPPVATCPALPEITMVQVSVWDNWRGPKPVTGKPHRYGATVSVWTDTDPAAFNLENPQWVASGPIWAPEAITKELKRITKPKANGSTVVDPRYAASLEEFTVGEFSICPLQIKKGGGTTYLPFQFVAINTASGNIALSVARDEFIELAPLVSVNLTGKPLSGNVHLQSRTDLKLNWKDGIWSSRHHVS